MIEGRTRDEHAHFELKDTRVYMSVSVTGEDITEEIFEIFKECAETMKKYLKQKEEKSFILKEGKRKHKRNAGW